jgi:molybdate transport system substrate-binding protein
MRLATAFGRLALFICLCCGVPRLFAAELTVFAAASLTDALREIARDYQKGTGDRIVFNFAASSTLARQIEAGAPADLFFSADEAQMNRLQSGGQIIEGTRQDRLSNSLVIVVAAENGVRIRSPKDLAGPAIRRITLGDPRAVPIGVYARKYLEKMGLWEAVAPKVVPTENVRGALAAVEEGNADASIVYKTDALVSKRVVIAYAVPVEEGPEIRYSVALVRGAKEPQASRGFLAYLEGVSATKIFERRGFVVLKLPLRQ